MFELENIHYAKDKSSYLSDIFDAEDKSGKKYIIKKNKFRIVDETNRAFLEWIMKNPHPNLLAPLEIREESPGKLTEIYGSVEWPLFSALFSKMFPFEGNRGSLEFNDTLKIIEQVTSAIGYIHLHGFVHHDVRAGNMFLNPESLDVKLFDYNLTQRPYFLDRRIDSWDDEPPECMVGNTVVDFGYDVYKAGSVLFSMTHAFFPGKYKKRSLRPGIPLEALPVINKAYSGNNEERYRDCNEMLEAIKTLERSLAVSSVS